jgi:hypothetical protein
VPQSLLAKIARIGGNRLLNQAVDRIDSATPTAKPSLTGTLAGAALVRIASRSVPGAIVVTGGLIAKTLHDRRKAKRQVSGLAQLAAPTDDPA